MYVVMNERREVMLRNMVWSDLRQVANQREVRPGWEVATFDRRRRARRKIRHWPRGMGHRIVRVRW